MDEIQYTLGNYVVVSNVHILIITFLALDPFSLGLCSQWPDNKR